MCCAAGAAITLLLSSGAALAQSVSGGILPSQDPSAPTAADTSEVVVTGSRIRHNPFDQPSPITFIDQADIAKTGLSSIADVLQRLPGSGGGLNTKTNYSGNIGNPPNGGGVGAGSAEINLRTLGSNRTLVLVDSLRYVNGASASGVPGTVDLNSIPNAAIERVEVLQDGASALYGSDAIAGVVNIITKTRQDGFLGSAQVGGFGEGDGFTQKYDFSYGFGSDRTGTQVVLGVSYVDQQPVHSGDRSISQYPQPFLTACTSACSSATPNGRYDVLGGDYTLKAAVAGKPTFDPLNPTGPGSGFRDFTTADRFDFAPYNYFLTPYQQIGTFINVEQKIAPDVKFSGKFYYNRRNSDNEAAFLPLFIGPDGGTGFPATIAIDATNPYNPFGRTLDPGNYSFIARRVVEGGQRRYTQNVDTYYGSGTFSGKFAMFGRDFFWDATGIYGSNSASQIERGNINSQHLAQALGPVAGCTGACVPLNLFGGLGTITPAMLNYIEFDEHDKSKQEIADGSINLTGSVFDLPAGPLGVAVGYEHRYQKGSFTPDPIVSAGFGSDIAALPTTGDFNADEVYGEFSVPVVKDLPLLRKLDASFAVRYSDYSTSGSQATIKGGLNWKPVQDLLLRGSYSEGYRAPSIGELFGSASRADAVVDDPCSSDSSSQVNRKNSSVVAGNCAAQGVPAGYTQLGAQKGVVTGGNPDLKAETSRSWVGGGVYSASWASRWARVLTLEANYFNIKVENAVQAIGADTLLGRCEQTADALSCAAISRGASGNITQILGLLGNIGAIKTDGVDVNLTYRSRSTGMGSFGLYWANSVMLSYNEIVPNTDGFTKVRRVGTEEGSPSDQAFARYKSNATVDWTVGPFTASVTGRYISGVHETQTGDAHALGERLYGDVQLLWSTEIARRAVNFALGVNNITGVSPPACFSCSLNNSDPTTYDVPGQFVYARVGLKI